MPIRRLICTRSASTAADLESTLSCTLVLSSALLAFEQSDSGNRRHHLASHRAIAIRTRGPRLTACAMDIRRLRQCLLISLMGLRSWSLHGRFSPANATTVLASARAYCFSLRRPRESSGHPVNYTYALSVRVLESRSLCLVVLLAHRSTVACLLPSRQLAHTI